MKKLIKILIAVILIELAVIAYLLIIDNIDYTRFNAEQNNKALQEYAKYAEGVNLYEAPYTVNLDLSLKNPKNLFEGDNYAAYYYEKGKFIKIDAGKYYTLPHELGHHFWALNLTKNDVMKFCSNTKYGQFSYDGSCSEGFAELFGKVIVVEKDYNYNWKLEEGMFYMENERIFSRTLENNERMEKIVNGTLSFVLQEPDRT